MDRFTGCCDINDYDIKNTVNDIPVVSKMLLIRQYKKNYTFNDIISKTLLTLSKTTNFRLFKIERVCRRLFQICEKW